MAYKILRDYLSSDIVDYCVLPYLMPEENEVKEKHKGLMISFDLYILCNAWNYGNEEMVVLMGIKEKYHYFWYQEIVKRAGWHEKKEVYYGD